VLGGFYLHISDRASQLRSQSAAERQPFFSSASPLMERKKQGHRFEKLTVLILTAEHVQYNRRTVGGLIGLLR
jgi:hypothetical protein